jgi:hypothetical protein
MRRTSGALSRRSRIVTLTGVTALFAAYVGSPAQAFVMPAPNGTTPTAATGTLALCVGAQQGSTGYIYAEGVAPQGTAPAANGMDLIPSQFTQLLVTGTTGAPGIDCRAYPADPGSYEIRTYKFPMGLCAGNDKTRPNNPPQTSNTPPGNTPPGECLAKVHHIHIIHMNGAVTSVDSNGVPYLNNEMFSTNPSPPFSDGTSVTTECWTPTPTQTPTFGSGTCNSSGSDGHTFGWEYTTELVSGNLPEDTVIDAQTVTVEVVAHETTEVITHLPDHETSDCFSSFGPDVNGNTPVCN